MNKTTSKMLTFYKYLILNKLTQTKSKLKIEKLYSIVDSLSRKNYITSNFWHPISILDLSSDKPKNGYFLKKFGLNNSNYKAYIKFLVELDIIEIYEQFSKDMHMAKQARLKPLELEVYNTDTEDVQLCPEYIEYRKQTKIDIEKYSKDLVLLSHYNLMMSNRITVDDKAANEYIDKWYSTGQIDMKKNKLTKISIELVQIYKKMIEEFNKKIFYFERGANNNRLYHSFAGMKRELRRFIRIDNQPFYEVDLKNCQPFILSELVKTELPNNKDVIEFNNLCISSSIYEYFMEHMKMSRNSVKNAFLSYMFAPIKDEDKKRDTKGNIKNDISRSQSFKDMDHIFMSFFPSVFAFILKYKLNNYKQLAIDLQKIEANIFTSDNALIDKGGLSCFDAVYVKQPIIKTARTSIINSASLLNINININQLSLNKPEIY